MVASWLALLLLLPAGEPPSCPAAVAAAAAASSPSLGGWMDGWMGKWVDVGKLDFSFGPPLLGSPLGWTDRERGGRGGRR